MTTNLFLNRTRWLHSAFCTLILLFSLGIGNVWGTTARVSAYGNITSGNTYFIGATTSSTDYYFKAGGGINTGTRLSGTSTTTPMTDGTVVTFTGSSTSWTIKFTNNNYLTIPSSDDNGKYDSQTSSATWTLSNESSLIKMTINNHVFQKNKTSAAFGSYKTTSNQINVWLEPALKVTYNANSAASGSVPTDGTYYLTGSTVTVKNNSGSLTRTGYSFAGWNTKADGTGTTYTAGTGTFSISGNITLYAKWDVATEPRTVTFNTGTGNPTVSSRTEASGGAGITLPAGPTPACSGDGWEFAGWKETSAVTSETSVAPTLLSAGENYYPLANCTLYAVYTRISGGSGGAPVGTIVYSENFGAYSANDVLNGSVSSSTGNRVIYNGGSVTYTSADNGSNITKIYNDATVGAAAPELLIGKKGGVFTIAGISAAKASTLTLTYYRNNAVTPTVSGTGVSIGTPTSSGNRWTATITATSAATTFSLIFTAGSDNVRFDDVSIAVATTTTAGTRYYFSNPTCCTPLGSINGSFSWSNVSPHLSLFIEPQESHKTNIGVASD